MVVIIYYRIAIKIPLNSFLEFAYLEKSWTVAYCDMIYFRYVYLSVNLYMCIKYVYINQLIDEYS